MSFHPIDYAVIAFYFVLVLTIGLLTGKRKRIATQNFEDYLLAGRKLSLPFFIITLVSTWYGNILGVGEFVYRNGFVAWVCFGLPYYISAAFFAAFLAKKIRLANVRTIPEQITRRFGTRAGWISSIIMLAITVPAVYILMLGIIIQLFTGFELWICISAGAAITITYIFKGGLKSDVYVNILQFILMYTGFAVLLIFCLSNLGSFVNMAEKLPGSHKTIFGNLSWQYVVSWYIISFQTFIDPGFHQRCSAAGNPKTAQRGVFISIIFWAVFDFLTLATGLYAKAYILLDNPVSTFPLIGSQILPVFWKGFFIASILSMIMSALDGYALVSAATIGNDIIYPLQKKLRFKNQYPVESLTKFGLILTGILGVGLAVILPSAIDIIYETASVAVPGLLIPLLLSYSKLFVVKNIKGIFFIMIISSGVSFLWIIFGIMESKFHIFHTGLFGSIEPMLPGIVVSIILSLFTVKKKPKND